MSNPPSYWDEMRRDAGTKMTVRLVIPSEEEGYEAEGFFRELGDVLTNKQLVMLNKGDLVAFSDSGAQKVSQSHIHDGEVITFKDGKQAARDGNLDGYLVPFGSGDKDHARPSEILRIKEWAEVAGVNVNEHTLEELRARMAEDSD